MLDEKTKHTIHNLWINILGLIGEDVAREGLQRTPARVAEMYEEIFAGYSEGPPTITTFKRKTPGSLIIDKGYFFSMCEHHVIPFFGNYYFGYIPKNREIGASKIGRTVGYYSAKLQTAERLASEVLDRIENEANPHGSILIMSGRHLCKEMRGLRQHNSPFEVIEARGCLLKNHDGCKDEFIARIGARI